MVDFNIVRATEQDAEALCDIFVDHITAHTEYISHGEIQMGVGVGSFEDGVFVTKPSAHARRAWMRYVMADISADDACVFKAVSSAGEIVGFGVAEIQEDGAEPFGMVCDVLVKESCRRSGVGSALLDKALEWLKANGIVDIYLESGLNNHSAHDYFKRRGFVKVSEIYKLM